MASLLSIWIDGFLDGFTGAGLMGRLQRPGAPTEFVDSRTVEDFMESGEFVAATDRFTAAGKTSNNRPSHAVPAPQAMYQRPSSRNIWGLEYKAGLQDRSTGATKEDAKRIRDRR